MNAPAAASDRRGTVPRGTAVQRARATLVRGLAALLARLPGDLVGGLSDAGGELWYRVAPGRASMARGNLAHVAGRLADRGAGAPRARAAATDAAALERLVRAAFRHAVRSYAETLRGPAADRDVVERLVVETPATVEAAFAGSGPAVFATLHFGSMAGMAAIVTAWSRTPVTAPMETLGDPELQRVMRETRGRGGARLVDLADARRELRSALARGETVGLVGDRPIAGGGLQVPFFDLPATLPVGPAYLALGAGVALHVGTVRRAGRSGFRGRLVELALPPADLPFRERVEALLAAEAAVFEGFVAAAPEQWWTVFYPIWDAVGPLTRDAARAAAAERPSARGIA